MRTIILVATLGFLASPVFGGSIEGRVSAKGRELPESAVGGDNSYASRKAKFFEKVDYSQYKGFVVWLETTNTLAFPKPEKPVQVEISQKDAMFHPRVVPILVGTTVQWPNKDDIFHNVFSISETESFDLGLYRDVIKEVTFGKLGRVDVFCSIHKDMTCVILVLPNPWFAAAGEDGRYVIKDIPPGHYRLKAWHERLPPQMKEIDVTAEGTSTVDIVLTVAGLPQI